MERIVVDTVRLDQRAPELQRIAGDLQRIAGRMSDVNSSLRWSTSVAPAMRARITQQKVAVEQLQRKSGSLATAISAISAEYQKAETGQTQKTNHELGNKNANDAAPIFNGINSISANAGWLGAEYANGHPGVTAWIGKASAEAQNDWGYAGVNAYLGKAEAEAKADAGFMKSSLKKKYQDGEWTEKETLDLLFAEAGAGATVSAIAGDAKASAGNDMLGVEAKADGTVGKATAEAKGEFSIGEDGVNAVASGKAMVSAAEGKVSGTINILGIEITGKIGGYAGAAGVEGKIGIEDNKWVMEAGAAALLGVKGGIEVGFNDEGWSNFVDFITFWD